MYILLIFSSCFDNGLAVSLRSYSPICVLIVVNYPGGGTLVQRGVAPALRISRKKGSFLRPPHVRDFVKKGYFFVLRYEVWGSKSPYNPRNIRGYDAE